MEELDQEGLLKTLEGFPVGERVILGHFGTVQTLLALIFKCPITVHLQEQSEFIGTHEGTNFVTLRDPQGMYLRTVRLQAGKRELCIATSRIPYGRNTNAVLQDVRDGINGLGQIAMKHIFPVKRTLMEVRRDRLSFARHYVIEGRGLFMEIDEIFLREHFMDIGWV